jgi:hypothetical protein
MADGIVFASIDPVKDPDCTNGGRSIAWYVNQKLTPHFSNTKGESVPHIDINGDDVISLNDKIDGASPVGRETTSVTFQVHPQIDMNKSTMDVVTIELFNYTESTEGIFYANIGHSTFQNRLEGRRVNWKESTRIRK